MPLISERDLEDSYTSPDGSIFIDFKSLDKEKDKYEDKESDDDDYEGE